MRRVTAGGDDESCRRAVGEKRPLKRVTAMAGSLDRVSRRHRSVATTLRRLENT
jgi:hypothetical protein